MRKPVILLLGKLPPPYMGPAIATQILLNSGLKKDFDLVHLDTRVNKDINKIGKWSFSKINKNLGIYIELKKIIKEKKPDLIVIPISQSTIGFLKDSGFILLSILSKHKTILHLRGSNFKNWLDNSSLLTKWFTKKLLNSSQGVIVLGNKLRSLFSDYLPPEKIFVAPNGGDYTIPLRTRIENAKCRIVYLGNLQSSKGIEDVLDAFEIMNVSHEGKVELEVIGTWRNEETRKKCLDLVDNKNLPVRFYPSTQGPDKLQFLADADIFVFPPREPEGHPWVIVEAMAAGLPIISTDQGAITESVIHGQNGYIVNPGKPQEIAKALLILTDNPELRQRMGAESRKLYEKGFTEQKMVEKLGHIFREVIKK